LRSFANTFAAFAFQFAFFPLDDSRRLNTPIKLVFLVRSLDYGGAQRQLVTLAKALDKDRFDVTVISFYSGQPLERELEHSGVRFISLNKRGRWDVLGFLRRLSHQMRVIRPDVVHGYLDIPNLLALFLKPFVRAQIVWGIRAVEIDLSHYDWLLRLAAKLEGIFACFADLIIVNSTAGLEHHLARGFPPRKMVVIPNGIDTDVFRPDREAGARVRAEWRIAEDTKLIGTVGRLDPVKDLPTFLKAAANVAEKRSHVRFACVGPGPASYVLKLQQLADDLGIADLLLWPGARADISAIYNALDVFCSSSFAESFPNSIAEAMACGVPCVVTDVGDSASVIGECGHIVPPRNAEALAAGTISFLATEHAEIGRNARARIEENFSVGQMVKLTEESIVSLTKRSV
jgi:glycosyltransferase involved in cell wall biosynthesis